MSAVFDRNRAKRITSTGLMISASFMALLFADAAQAQCVTNNGQPLNGIQVDGTVVTCTGAVSGETIASNANAVEVEITGAGTDVSGGSNIFLIGDQSVAVVRSGASLTASTIYTLGNGNLVWVQGTANGAGITVDGDDSDLLFDTGSTVNIAPGNLAVLASPTGTNFITLRGTLSGSSSTGSYLLRGGNGSQLVSLSGTLSVQSDGLAMNLGDGDDEINITSSAIISGGTGNNILFDGGQGNDLMRINGGGVSAYNSIGIETLVLDPGAGNVRVLSGAHADVTQFSVESGTVDVTNLAALGQANSTVQIQSGAQLWLSQSGVATFDHVLAGNGTLALNSGGGTYTFGGTGSTFAGTFQIAAGDTAIIATADALGTATFQNSGVVRLGGINLENDISGTGQVIVTSAGNNTRLSGNNSFSGGLDIQGVLEVASLNALGTGDITASTNSGVLSLEIGTDGVLSNDLTGNLTIVKSGAGVVDLTGTNSYTGNTLINDGAIRIDSFARLGGGMVFTGSAGNLILNYNGAGQLLQTTPFMVGDGTFIKEGTGDVVMNQISTYTGGTIIRAGRIGLNNGGALGTGNIQVDTGAILGIGGITLANTVSGTGSIIKTANNLATLSGDNSGFTGLFDVQDGAVELLDGRAAGSGTLAIANGTAVFVNSTVGDTTIAANITGAGDLENLSNTRLTLTGNNSLSGNVFVSNGTLQVSGSQNIGIADIIIAGSAARLNLDTAGNTTFFNAISGNGSVVKTGAGTVTLTGTNSYAGGTDIQGGSLRVADVGALSTGPVTTAAGTALIVDNGTNQTLTNVLTGAGRLEKSGTGDLAVTQNGLTGGLTISGGRLLAVAGLGSIGTGPVSIASGAELVYTGSSNSSFANGLSGAGTFRKVGSGQLLFANPFAIGLLAVDAGSVRLNSTLTGNAIVASGARLDGTGRVIGTLTNNGTVAPGNSIGTMTVEGNYVHNSGSVLEIEFDGTGAIDLLAVTGTATLNGGTLRFVSIGAAEGLGGTFLTATGGVSGTFATVETVGAQLPLAVIYQPNAGLMAPSVLTARPSTFNAQSLAAADTALSFIDAIGAGDGRHGNGSRVWMSGFGAWGSRSASGSTLGYDHETRGLSGGVNVDVGSGVTLGAAVGWAKGDITLGENGGGGDQSSLMGAITARYDGSGFTLGGGVLYGQVDQDTVRNVSFSGFSDSVNGQTESTLFGVFAELGLPLGSTGGWAFSANVRGSYIGQRQEAYTESGTSPLRLRLDDLSTDSVEGQARLTAKTRLWAPVQGAEETSEGLDLRIEAGGRYLDALGDRAIPVTFAASNAGVVLQGDTRNSVQGLLGLGLDYTTRNQMTFSLGYQGEVGQTDRHSVQGRVSIAF